LGKGVEGDIFQLAALETGGQDFGDYDLCYCCEVESKFDLIVQEFV
jgi:hypothetical protein